VRASKLAPGGTVTAAVGLLLVVASTAAAQGTGAFKTPPFDSPPLVSDGIDTTAVQTHTGQSRFSVGQHGPSTCLQSARTSSW
jgi:hypothetical protein